MTPLDTAPQHSFAKLGVRDEIVRALLEEGIEHTFAIQELTLPLALDGDDLIGQARTGMGKTFAFGVPLLHRITTDIEQPLSGIPRALIVVPTRELCLQVYGDLAGAAKYLTAGDRPLSVVSIYGGRPYEPQIEALRAGADVVVGTPGRLLDLAQQGHLKLGGLSVLVLDEADEMLDLGFLPDIERILRQIPDDRQSMLFSATMPDPIITLARTFMNQPTHIRAESPESSAVHDLTEQFVYRAHAMDKAELVSRVLQAHGRGATMIFTRTKRTAQKVADELADRGFKVGAVHGDLGQVAREKALKSFRTGDVDVLVATDVAARGIDIDDVTHVVNYQCPDDEKTYVHRIGRTGRAGKTGVAVTLVDWDELPRWTMIDKALELGCPNPPETYSSSAHLYAEIGIPADATGTVGTPRKSPAKRPSGGPERNGPKPASRHTANRSRRRTRGGNPLNGPAGTNGEAPHQTPPAHTDAAPSDDAGPTGRQRRRGRRRHSPSGAAPNTNSVLFSRHPMVRPERRTKGDLLAAAAIAVTIALATALIWWTSDARAAISRPAAVPAPVPTAARELPAALNQLWDTASPATSRPVLVGGTVVTGAGREINGRDPATGESLWSYARDSDLCAASWVYTYAVAVYRDARGCGQVSAIEGVTGRRGPSRTSYADRHVDVSSDGTTVLSFGQTRLELWRSDLVRMLSYGEIDAPLKPSSHGLGTGCTLVSAAASSSAVSVLESCPQQQDLRLTLLRPGKEEDEPEVRFVPEPGVTANSGARVLVVSDTSTAVYLPSPQPRVEVIDSAGTTVASTLLPKPPAPVASTVSRAGDLVTWWTGDAVMVFDATRLTYRYTIGAVGPVTPLGPAATMTGKILIPVTDGIGVYDPVDGTNERYITVHRPPNRSVVVPAVYGSRIFEQRGDTVVALG